MNSQAIDILKNNVLGALATVNPDGSPWNTPLHIFFDDNALYWFSQNNTQHSRNAKAEPRVCITVWSPDKSMGLKAIYVSGIVQILPESEAQVAKQLVKERLGEIPNVFDSATCYKLPVEKLDSSKSYGNCWYFYT